MAETNFIDGLEPLPHPIVLEEGQPSLFVDTPLDLQLKTLGVDTLIVCGVASDISIEFTCRHAAALDYFTVDRGRERRLLRRGSRAKPRLPARLDHSGGRHRHRLS
ncbi:MAG TPA: isochorismatase family protein, partial [Pseudolabrys sp.]|nr:isochorismatase family protein [Pseudolabrys sp.]